MSSVQSSCHAFAGFLVHSQQGLQNGSKRPFGGLLQRQPTSEGASLGEGLFGRGPLWERASYRGGLFGSRAQTGTSINRPVSRAFCYLLQYTSICVRICLSELYYFCLLQKRDPLSTQKACHIGSGSLEYVSQKL